MKTIKAKLIGGFLFFVLMIVALAFFSTYESQIYLQESIGQGSVFIANEMLVNMNMAIYDRIDRFDVRTRDRLILDAVGASNREFDGMSSPVAHMERVEAEWKTASTDVSSSSAAKATENLLAAELRRIYITYRENRDGFQTIVEVVVTNKYGATAAATRVKTSYRYDGSGLWQKAKESGAAVGEIAEHEEDHAMVIPIAVAIRDYQDEFIGVFMAMISADTVIRNAVVTYKKYETTQVKLTTDGGKLIYSTKPYKFLEDVSQKDFFRNAKGASGTFIATEGGRATLFSYSRAVGYLTFPGMPWILLVGHDVNEVLAPSFTLRNNIVIACAVLVLAGVLIALLLSRSITKPIAALQKAAAGIARGNLDTAVDARRKDEIGMLARSFTRMIESLRETASIAQRIASGDLTVQAVKRSEEDVLGRALENMLVNLRAQIRELMEGASNLAASTSEISTSTSQLASSAAESAASISEATATVEEVKRTAQLAAQKAGTVAAEAQKTAELSRGGRQAVEGSVKETQHIREQMDAIAESIVRLSDQSRAIGEIIETVNGLADQSNLLAVNAAIEAARAGEQGKSFTVVAHEIRNLAEQSKRATIQVKTILNDIQKATSAAVMATEQGSKAVEAGVRQSSDAGTTIQRFAENSERAMQAAAQIAVSSQQQQVGMDQMTLVMEHIKDAGNQNLQSSRQLESEAKNLHGLGQKLKDLTEKYKV